MRALAIAVISVSCAAGGDPNAVGQDAHVFHPDPDAAHTVDASHDAQALDAAVAIDAPQFACKPANIIHGDGHHNPGQDCFSSCHDHGFSVAGTLYQADGVTPAADATVTVVDATGNSQDIVASSNGNFFSFFPVAYPITMRASLCPSVQVMVGNATVGGCNSTGCHEPGGVQGTIHL